MTELQTPEWLTRWGFSLAKEAPTGKPVERESPDPYRDVQQVKQMIEEQGVTPAMILSHPFLKLTDEAKRYLEEL